MSAPNIITGYASGAITAGCWVRIAGAEGGLPQVIQSTDGTTATAHNNCGIALDTVADNALVSVQIGDLCHVATAAASITLGAMVTCDANGKTKVAASGDRAIGRLIKGNASTGATADTAPCTILIFPTPFTVA
jgi:hypothetical protein